MYSEASRNAFQKVWTKNDEEVENQLVEYCKGVVDVNYEKDYQIILCFQFGNWH